MPATTRKKGKTLEKTCVKSMGFCSFADESLATAIDVKDNRILRVRPLHFDWKYKPEEFRPWKIEARGKVFEPTMKTLIGPLSLAYKKRVYSPNRILYPLKRVDWDPNGERNIENRGKSPYVRISWDEALKLVTDEIKRMYRQYGPYAILMQGDGHGENKVVHGPHGCGSRLLEILGGGTQQIRNSDSWEGWYWGAKHVWGCDIGVGLGPQQNMMPEVAENAELLLFWGGDPETTTWGWGGQQASRLCYWFTELGIQQVYVCPDLNYGAAVHANKWIPILPNTDAALHLAIAYIWITQGTYDKEYVATHTVGYDKFEEYVLGKEDGVAKTPTWASEKTSVPTRIIKALARAWVKKRTCTVHGNGGPYIRGAFSTEPARLEVLLLAMQGVGKPGRQMVKMLEWGWFNQQGEMPLPRGIFIPQMVPAYRGWTPRGPLVPAKDDLPKQHVPKNMVHDAILNPPISWYGTSRFTETTENQFVKYTYPVKGCPEIHMIWTDSPCWLTCWNDSNNIVDAFRSPKIEFILAQHPWLESDCLFADVILPVNTKFEEEDMGVDHYSGLFNTVFHEEKCIEPIGESYSDYEIVCMIAEKLGVLDKYTRNRSVEDWMKFAFQVSGAADHISYEELKKKQYWVVPIDPEWKKYPPGLREFYEDPEKHPLKTPTGKIEFYSERLAKSFPVDEERPPVPKWIEKSPLHDDRLSSERAKKYPLLCMSNHGRWRVHANHDDITWFHEIETCKVRGADGYLYEPIWIHPTEARKRGIEHGDVVKVFNEKGGVLCGAYITERIMPGVAYVDHGARYDPIVPGKLDRGGAINTITPHNNISKNCTGMVVSGFLVEAERVNLDELMEEYPEAFSRPYDHASGQCMERVLEKAE